MERITRTSTLCSAHGSRSSTSCHCAQFSNTTTSTDSAFIRRTDWALRMLDRHRHWWIRTTGDQTPEPLPPCSGHSWKGISPWPGA
jgi:hypothetical protein